MDTPKPTISDLVNYIHLQGGTGGHEAKDRNAWEQNLHNVSKLYIPPQGSVPSKQRSEPRKREVWDTGSRLVTGGLGTGPHVEVKGSPASAVRQAWGSHTRPGRSEVSTGT